MPTANMPTTSVAPPTPAILNVLTTLSAPAGETLGAQVYKSKNVNANPIQAPADGELLYGTSGNDCMKGTAEDDHLVAGAGHDFLSGGAGDDTLEASAFLNEPPGVDTHDYFNVLEGGAGDDDLYGGAGMDYFVFGRDSGADWVYDFEANPTDHDIIVIETNVNGSGIKSFADVLSRAHDDPANLFFPGGVHVDLGKDNELLLEGVSKAQLTADMFEFRYASILDVPSG